MNPIEPLPEPRPTHYFQVRVYSAWGYEEYTASEVRMVGQNFNFITRTGRKLATTLPVWYERVELPHD